MALESQIRAAAIVVKPPVGDSGHSTEVLLAMPRHHWSKEAAERLEAAERAGAERMARRLANHHACKGLCDEPEHARDAADLPPVLAALGLVPTDRTTRPCPGCGQSRPLTAFRLKPAAAGGRDARCSTCISTYHTSKEAT